MEIYNITITKEEATLLNTLANKINYQKRVATDEGRQKYNKKKLDNYRKRKMIANSTV